VNLLDFIIAKIAEELKIKKSQVKSTIDLIDEGNTIPFIARYRKEATGNLSDVMLRDLSDRLTYLRNLEKRKDEIIRLIDEQGKLTENLKAEIMKSQILAELEDLYRPYKQKKRTRATIAKERGLEPLALKVLLGECDVRKEAEAFIDPEKDLENIEDVIKGVMDIIAEIISDNPDYRKSIRYMTYNKGNIISKKNKDVENSVHEMYFEYEEEIRKIPPHRILAMNRGEKEEELKIKISSPDIEIIDMIERDMIKNLSTKEVIQDSIRDAYKRLIQPSIEREIRNELTAKAEEQAIKVFGSNIKNLLMMSPVKDTVVMGFDPAYRTGCKIAIINEMGDLLDYTTVYPTKPENKIAESKKILKGMIEKHKVNIIAIGNGTASRESEQFVAEMIKEIDREVFYTIVNEAGASVYSASKLANEEYPEINVSIRGAISIAGRLQDPMAELVKIDPKSIGVGQYQHDVNQKRLEEVLEGVVEDTVNNVGVDLNRASASLLKYISGISKSVAGNIVKYRNENGPFKSRRELLKVARLGPSAFTQCAGFLRIENGKNILDNTGVHPESYDVAKKLIDKLDLDIQDITSINEKLSKVSLEKLAEELEVGNFTLEDIIKELKKPGRDPREDMPKPIFRGDVLQIEDLDEDMILDGTVRNVTDFGAFVDIGLKNDGLVHISQLSDRFVKNPMDIVKVGDNVKVRVLSVDLNRKRVSLSMKKK
jgi:uncharacterized protein